MKKNKVDAFCAQWLSDCLDPNDQEAKAAFQNWLERCEGGEARSVTMRDVVTAWQAIIERRKLH